jgi:hypothetical protein
MDEAARCVEEAHASIDIIDQTPISRAWHLINTIAMESFYKESKRRAPSYSIPSAESLKTVADFARRSKLKVPKTRAGRSAEYMLADSLYASRKHAGLSCSTTLTGATVAELVTVAKLAGNKAMTNHAAQKILKKVLKGSNSRQKED